MSSLSSSSSLSMDQSCFTRDNYKKCLENLGKTLKAIKQFTYKDTSSFDSILYNLQKDMFLNNNHMQQQQQIDENDISSYFTNDIISNNTPNNSILTSMQINKEDIRNKDITLDNNMNKIDEKIKRKIKYEKLDIELNMNGKQIDNSNSQQIEKYMQLEKSEILPSKVSNVKIEAMNIKRNPEEMDTLSAFFKLKDIKVEECTNNNTNNDHDIIRYSTPQRTESNALDYINHKNHKASTECMKKKHMKENIQANSLVEDLKGIVKGNNNNNTRVKKDLEDGVIVQQQQYEKNMQNNINGNDKPINLHKKNKLPMEKLEEQLNTATAQKSKSKKVKLESSDINSNSLVIHNTISSHMNELGKGDKEVDKSDKEVGKGEKEAGKGDKEVGKGEKEVGKGEREVGKGEREVGKGEREVGKGDREVGKGDREVGKGDREVGKGDREVGKGDREVCKGDRVIVKGDRETSKYDKEVIKSDKDAIKKLGIETNAIFTKVNTTITTTTTTTASTMEKNQSKIESMIPELLPNKVISPIKVNIQGYMDEFSPFATIFNSPGEIEQRQKQIKKDDIIENDKVNVHGMELMKIEGICCSSGNVVEVVKSVGGCSGSGGRSGSGDGSTGVAVLNGVGIKTKEQEDFLIKRKGMSKQNESKEVKEVKEVKEAKEVKEIKEVKETKGVKEIKESKEIEQGKSSSKDTRKSVHGDEKDVIMECIKILENVQFLYFTCGKYEKDLKSVGLIAQEDEQFDKLSKKTNEIVEKLKIIEKKLSGVHINLLAHMSQKIRTIIAYKKNSLRFKSIIGNISKNDNTVSLVDKGENSNCRIIISALEIYHIWNELCQKYDYYLDELKDKPNFKNDLYEHIDKFESLNLNPLESTYKIIYKALKYYENILKCYHS